LVNFWVRGSKVDTPLFVLIQSRARWFFEDAAHNIPPCHRARCKRSVTPFLVAGNHPSKEAASPPGTPPAPLL